MIHFNYDANGVGEGKFTSTFFRDDRGNDEFLVYIFNNAYEDYAETCVKHFNALSPELINVICYHIIKSARENNRKRDFVLPMLEKNTDILDYCWFKAMIVSIPGDKSKASYIIEGEGDWGELIGFVVIEDVLTYIGKDYLPNL